MRRVRPIVTCAPLTPSVSETPLLLKLMRPSEPRPIRFGNGNPLSFSFAHGLAKGAETRLLLPANRLLFSAKAIASPGKRGAYTAPPISQTPG